MNRAACGYCLQSKTVGAWAERLVLYVCACVLLVIQILSPLMVSACVASAAGREVCCYIIRKSSKFASRERERESKREDKTMRV
jgi:hypothetical protein